MTTVREEHQPAGVLLEDGHCLPIHSIHNAKTLISYHVHNKKNTAWERKAEAGVAALMIPPNDLLRDIVLPLLWALLVPEGACFVRRYNKGPRERETLTTA